MIVRAEPNLPAGRDRGPELLRGTREDPGGGNEFLPEEEEGSRIEIFSINELGTLY